MALASNTALATFNQVAGQFLDLSDILAELIRYDNTALLNRITMDGVATETIHSWVEDGVAAITITAASALASASTGTIETATALGGNIVVGAILKDAAAAGNALAELCQVTAVSASGTQVTLSRGYGGSSGTAHAASATWLVIATPAQEDADIPSDMSVARTKVSNFTQVFLRGVKVSYSSQAILQAGVPSEFGHQVSYRLKELMRELDASIINSYANGSVGTGSSSQYRSMGGLVQFATGGSVGVSQVLSTGATYTTAEVLTPDLLNTMASAVWYRGGMTTGFFQGFLLVSGKQKRRIAQFDQAYRRMDYNQGSAGYTVEKFLSDLGFEFQIIVDPWMADDTVVLGDLSRIKVMPLKGQAMHVEDIAKTGRALKGMVTGEYTAEFRNAANTTAIHVNLT